MKLSSMHNVGLICMLVMVLLRCTFNSYLLLMVLVILISKKIRELITKKKKKAMRNESLSFVN